MTSWRNCTASLTLIGEVNGRWPHRSKVSDGTIGDEAHQKAGTSDHLPNSARVVRARDITAAGIDPAWLAEYLRQLGAAGDGRLADGGYVIFNRRITKPNWSGWKTYTGSNPHTHHVHVSFSRLAAGYDSPRPWGIYPPFTVSTPPPLTTRTDLSEDEPMAPIPITVVDGQFRATVMAEAGVSSSVVARAWITAGSTWGDCYFKITALDNDGNVMPGRVEVAVLNNRRTAMEIPSGAVMVTIEGHVAGMSVIPAAALVVQGK